MNAERLAHLTIAELGRALRSGGVRAVAVTEVCLDRIARLDGTLNAFVTVTADLALEQAARADAERARGVDRGPLHGVPVAVKDLVDVAGVATTFGSRAGPVRCPARHAACVANLERAGAVIVGKTNLLEFAYGAVHPQFGQTNNPWDPRRTSGGSSGGSAAAVAAGMAYAAVGTDTGGSIRIPAAYCGITGIKPSLGRVPTDGVFPLSPTLDHVGPLARSPACAAAALAAMAGEGAEPASVDLRGARLGVLTAHRDDPAVRPAVRDAFVAACAALAAAGASVREVAVDELAAADEALPAILLPEASLV
ncbi:MAG: amidase, partial [Ectothiorhodospiraceae bacterium]|nr:amidase [Ectothiorhodospiraceae bacterium]